MAASRYFSLFSLLILAGVALSQQQNDKCTKPGDGVCYFRPLLQVYKFVSPDYSAMFVLTGGVTLVLAIAIIFISVGLLTMDPGKDSIIYRMTTTRMKKD